MTYLQITQKISSILEQSSIENAVIEAENLITEVLEISRSELVMRKIMNTALSVEDEEKLFAAAEKRALPCPLQYITGRAYFRNLVLSVRCGVLIPRFETEILVEHALSEMPKNGRLLDIGTGSGAIAIACATEREDISVVAVDISLRALEIAEENAKKYNLKNISFRESDLCSAINEDEKFDVVAANLPYVTLDEYPELHKQVRDWEPQIALTAVDDGMALIKEVCHDLSGLLTENGYAIFEMSEFQTQKIKELLQELGFVSEIICDYTGRARFVSAKKK